MRTWDWGSKILLVSWTVFNLLRTLSIYPTIYRWQRTIFSKHTVLKMHDILSFSIWFVIPRMSFVFTYVCILSTYSSRLLGKTHKIVFIVVEPLRMFSSFFLGGSGGLTPPLLEVRPLIRQLFFWVSSLTDIHKILKMSGSCKMRRKIQGFNQTTGFSLR